jgi:hypothetical protein
MSIDSPPEGRESAAITQLQVLATEHWSLLATRTMTFNESIGRVSLFLAIVSGALIALALVAQADHFGPVFVSIAIPMLSVVLFVGIATIARLAALNRDDFRWVVGMNRLRRAYLDLHPELEPNFITSPYDDLPGVLQTLGVNVCAGRRVGSTLHVLQTLPGMLTVIVAAIGGGIGGLTAVALSLQALGIVLAAGFGFLLVALLMALWNRRSITRLTPDLEPRFRSPTN